jgi:hypothetical protein
LIEEDKQDITTNKLKRKSSNMGFGSSANARTGGSNTFEV